MAIPAPVERALNDAVFRSLETELGNRHLLLTAAELVAAEADAAERGARLLAAFLRQCYSIRESESASAVEVAFESKRTVERIGGALAFGAVTAQVLVPQDRGPGRELLCAVFNLGIGLVDTLCDERPDEGVALLELLRAQDVLDAAEEPRERDWLREPLAPALAGDHTATFAADVIETFFETLHAVYPGETWLHHRHEAGTQLKAALEAELRSVSGPVDRTAFEELAEFSRLTSVLPFQIIEHIASGSDSCTDRSAATLLGEAMWQIDDLVDLCQDVRKGAANAVLLAAWRDRRHGNTIAALEGLLSSMQIAHVAAEGAERLRAALEIARHDQPGRTFLYFIQRYTGIGPAQTS